MLNSCQKIYEAAVGNKVLRDLIQSEIKDIGELATLEYLYTDAGKYEDAKKLFGKNIPFTSKSFITKWDGIIKAGVDIEQIIVEINDGQKESFRITFLLTQNLNFPLFNSIIKKTECV